MRKIVKYGIVALASVALLAGCSGGDDSKGEQATDKDGTKVFSAFFAVPGTEVPDDSRLNKAMAELTGARADVTWLTGQTAKERIGVMVSGGDYPDLVDASEGRSAMIDAGAFVPIEDYLDDYPNLKALYSEENWERIKADNDGHIYTIPQFNSVKEENMDPTAVGQAFWIQKRVLKWANYPKLTTVSEYFDLINAYLAENPETDGKKNIGFSILSDDWRYFCLENPPQFLAGYPNDGAAIIDTDTLEAKIYDDIPEAKEYYQILSEQYEKGVIDPETFTMKYDQYIAKISSGSVLGMVDQDWQFQSAVDSLKSQDKDELTYVPFGLTLDANVEQRYRVNMVNSAPNTQGGVGITINCKDVEGALEFLDSIVSEEATILRNWGEKGVDYEIDDDGQFYRTDEQRANWRNTDYSAKNGLAYGYLPQYTGMLPDGINTVIPAQQPEEFYASLTDIDREVLDAYGYEKWTDFVPEAEFDYPWFPIYTARNSWSSQDPAGIANQNMQEVKMQWLPKIVMNGPSNYEANWDDYMTDYKSRIDYKAFEEALTKEVKRRVEVDKELKEKLTETDSPGEESESSSN